MVCRTRLPNSLWTLYTSVGEPDYSPTNPDDPLRRERASITATYNALDAIKAANGGVPIKLYREVCKQLHELQDSDSGFWGTTHQSLEGGVETIGGIPRHTAMAIAAICEFGDAQEYDRQRLQEAVRWLVRTVMLPSGGWSYTHTKGRKRDLGALTTAAVIRSLHEYRKYIQNNNLSSVASVFKAKVPLDAVENAITLGLTALLKAQVNGLWRCQNDASQLANQFRDGLSILRWINPVVMFHSNFVEEGQRSVKAFYKACEDADYDNIMDPAAHPVALYLGCVDVARSYRIETSDTLKPDDLQSVRMAFGSGQLTHWDWQRCCIGLYSGKGQSKIRIQDRAVMLDVRSMSFRERWEAATYKSIVRKSILFRQINPLIAKGIIGFLLFELFIFILGLAAEANKWSSFLNIERLTEMINQAPS